MTILSRYLTFPALLSLAIALTNTSWNLACASELNPAADHAVVEALLRLPPSDLKSQPKQLEAVKRYLKRNVGTPRYVRVAKDLKVLDGTAELQSMLQAIPFSNLSIDAAKLLIQSEQFDAIEQSLTSDNSEAAANTARALGYAWHKQTFFYLRDIIGDESANQQVRIAAADALTRSSPGQKFLLGLAKNGNLPEDIRFAASNGLQDAKDKAVRDEARKLVPASATSQSEPLPAVKQLAKMRGNAERGKIVFNKQGTCIKCHKVLGEGKEVGPDLTEIGSKLSREDMYVAILNPSAAVSHNYETYTLLDANAKTYSGLLINQTNEAATIRDAEGIDHTVLAEDIEQLKKQSISLMPADLQKAMSLQQLVDLVDYLVLLKKKGEVPFHALTNSTQNNSKTQENSGNHDPQEAIPGFDVAEGLQVELFAFEPQLLSPTSIDIDAKGRVWVCEAVNYRHFRNPQNEERSEGDRILVLEDTDGDGKADKETVFFQDKLIDSPHGVCVVGDQIIVSAGENVIVFTDSNDDLKPDSQRILFSGISGVQHDHGIHAFGAGPDGKLYFNFGNEGKQLKGPNGETIVDKAGNIVNDSRQPYQQGMVFRCNPDGTELETLGWNFRNNWEVCVDSFGTLWQSDNDDDGNRGTRINFVMEFGNYGYRDERDGASWRASRIGLESEIPLQHWHLNDPGVVPNILQTGAGSPTGICVYEGDLLPLEFQNQVIHTDPGPNVVRAYPVEKDGAGYKASIQNLVKGVNDPWFRPVDVCTAPDGSLFVADWYDPGVGGHRMGDIEHGRIFRITPIGHQGYSTPSLDLTTAAGAVEALQSPNLATRFLAQSTLPKFGDESVTELENLARNGSERMKARALWQLGLIAADPAPYIQQALADESEELRILGIRMARQHESNVLAVVEQVKNEVSSHVRREALIALRGRESAKATKLWVDLAMQHDGKDRWYLEALGIAGDLRWDELFDAWITRVGDNWNTLAGRDIIWRCRSQKACKYLAILISQSSTEEEQYRYFRAFDFLEGEPKLNALKELAAGSFASSK